MNRVKIGFAVLVAAVLFVGGSFAANSAFGAGWRGQHGRFGHDPLFRLMCRLDLSDAQKQQLAGILKQQEAEAKTVATGLATARVQLAKTILSGADVTAAAQQVATYQVQAAQLRSQIMSQLLAILTPDQKAIIDNIQTKMGTHIDAAIDAKFARLDKWIARHSQ